MSSRWTLSTSRKDLGPWEDDPARQCRPGRKGATRPHSNTLQERQGVRTPGSQSSTSRTEMEEALPLACPSTTMRRRATQRRLPRQIATRTSARYAVRTDMPCTTARSCRRNNVSSRRTGTTATRWRRVPERAISSGSWSARAVPPSRFLESFEWGASAPTLVKAGTDTQESINGSTRPSSRDTWYPRRHGGGHRGRPHSPRGYRTPSCTSKVGQGDSIPRP